jgi:hypothetical protein
MSTIHEFITVITIDENGDQRDFLETGDWFQALTFVKDAAQADLKVEVTSREVTL